MSVNSNTIPLGPYPSAATAVELTPARMRVLRAVNSFNRPATVVQIAATVGGHPNTSRVHLEELASEGYIDCEPEPPRGRGRPALRYSISPLGRTKLTAPSDIDHRALAQALAQQCVLTRDPQMARQLGSLWARALISTLPDDQDDLLQHLVDLLASMGFSPEVSEDRTSVLLHTCPLVEEARQDPDMVCAMHRSLIAGAMEEWNHQADTQLLPFAAPGHCTMSLELPSSQQD